MKNIILLGRPGCGKSIVYRKIQEALEASGSKVKYDRVDDFPILKSLHDSDVKEGRTDRFMPTEDGGFKVVDDGIWDELLVRLGKQVRQRQGGEGILAIEFSRPNNLHSLELFDREVLDNSIAVYIDASFECCVKRNEERTKRAEEEGIDAHFVSRREMEETYFTDDRDELLKHSPISVVRIKNDTGATPEDIEKQVALLVGKL